MFEALLPSDLACPGHVASATSLGHYKSLSLVALHSRALASADAYV